MSDPVNPRDRDDIAARYDDSDEDYLPTGADGFDTSDYDDYDDDDDVYTSYWGSTLGLPSAGDNWYPKVTKPQTAGIKLLRSGDFGKARNRLGTSRNSNIYSRLRRMALQPRAANAADLKHNLIPNTHGTTVAAYCSNIYVAQFSPGAPHGMPVHFRLYSLRLL